MTKRAIFRLIFGIVSVLALCLVVQTIYRFSCRAQKKVNHEKITEFIDETLVLEEGKVDEDFKIIADWIKTKNIYPEDRGRLYERASLIYEMKGDVLNYYKALGNALYYLDLSNEKNYRINIQLDLVNFFMSHCAYSRAQTIMEQIHKETEFDDIENLQIRGYAFRQQAVIDIYNKDYVSAEKNLLHSREITNMSHTGYYEESYLSIVDIYLAQVYLETNRIDEAKTIIDKYVDSPLLSQEIYHDVILRDLTVPFYQAYYTWAIKANQDTKFIEEVGQGYCEACEEAGLLAKEANTLLELINEYPSDDPEVNKQVYEVIDNVYRLMAEDQTQEYASLIYGQIESGTNDVASKEAKEAEDWQRKQTTIMTIMFIALLVVVIVVISSGSRRDSMTRLYNKRALGHYLNHLQGKDADYAVIMIDVDDFKVVNDTYGHPNGDIVLQRLSDILGEMQSGKARAYRYGGEEFTVVISTNQLRVAYHMAEQIRMIFENETWDFCKKKITISLGVACGHGHEDVVKQADENLYISKKNGKNCTSGYKEATV